MKEKDTTITFKRLATDEAYFTSVFKKTEKITSVIFYILSHINKSQKDNTHALRIEEKTIAVHELALESLQYETENAKAELVSFQYALIQLESTLRVAQAAGLISEEVLVTIIEQIDAVQRYVNNHFTKDDSFSLDIKESPTLPAQTSAKSNDSSSVAKRRKRVQIPAGDISSDAYLVYSQMTDRAERIKTVLEAKPEASVKDIAEVITDVSEKTIQRELNSLIEKGQVIREGERRWSKYSVKK